jgi:hypothetical protein
MKVPAAQYVAVVHDEAAADENFPAAQSTHMLADPLPLFPARQSVHDLFTVVVQATFS